MKKILFIEVRHLALLLFAIVLTPLCAQTPIHLEVASDVGNITTKVGLQNVDSAVLIFGYSHSTSSVTFDEQIAVRVNKVNLSVIDTITMPNFSSPTVNVHWGWYIQSSDLSSTYYAYRYRDTSNYMVLQLYQVNSQFEIGDTIFSIKEDNRVFSFVDVINNEFVIGYFNARVGHDSLFIKTFNLNGNLKSSREYDAFSQTDNQIYGMTFLGIMGAVEHPQIEDAFILAHPNQNKIFVVNQNTLDTIRTYNVDTLGAYLINYAGYWTRHNSELRVENDGVVLTGTVHLDPDTNIQTSGFDFQYYEFKQFWDGTFSIRDFGPRDVDNRGYASGINRSTNTKVIAGAIPFSAALFTVAEKREVLVYVYDDYGKLDSIYLHGDYNHVPTKLFVDDNGDIFISGMYTEAWGTGAAHAWLTKIPGLAVGMIEQNKINNHLFIYPNPTVQTIQIKEVSKFVNGNYEIYSQLGAVVKQGSVTAQEIDVSQFPAGVYILTVRNQNGEQFNAIFVKE